MSLWDVGSPKPLFAVKRNTAGSSVLGVATAGRLCLTGAKPGPGIRGPRLAGTASYSGKSSGATGGGRGGRGGRGGVTGPPRGGRETGGNSVLHSGKWFQCGH